MLGSEKYSLGDNIHKRNILANPAANYIFGINGDFPKTPVTEKECRAGNPRNS